MKIYQSKIRKLSGSDYREVYSQARTIYKEISSKTKRKPYIRSVYFNKDKIFLHYYWEHLWTKNWRDRVRRLKYYSCAIDLIKNSRVDPVSKENPNKKLEILHRFAGITKDKELFFVQIKEDKRSGEKYFTSVFPEH
ncbi:MAG: hypothetical protein WC657_04020 [Candidatus Paceibacterota bacterium]|jgi:hypothetical protein